MDKSKEIILKIQEIKVHASVPPLSIFQDSITPSLHHSITPLLHSFPYALSPPGDNHLFICIKINSVAAVGFQISEKGTFCTAKTEK